MPGLRESNVFRRCYCIPCVGFSPFGVDYELVYTICLQSTTGLENHGAMATAVINGTDRICRCLRFLERDRICMKETGRDKTGSILI